MQESEQEQTRTPVQIHQGIVEMFAQLNGDVVGAMAEIAFAGNDENPRESDFLKHAHSVVLFLLGYIGDQGQKLAAAEDRLNKNIRTIEEFNLALADYANQVGDPMMLDNLRLCIEQVKRRTGQQPAPAGPRMLTVEEMEKIGTSGRG